MKTLFLDTETTGLHPPKDGLVEIAIADLDGNVLLNTLVNPERPIGFASSIHNITDDMVKGAPTAAEIWPQVRRIVTGNHVVIYNSQFDTRFFPDGLSCASKISCAMLRFAKVYGETTNKPGGYKWQKLIKAADHIGYKWQGNAHRALADVNATRAVWEWMERRDEQALKIPPKTSAKVLDAAVVKPRGAPKRKQTITTVDETTDIHAPPELRANPSTHKPYAYKKSLGEKIELLFEVTFGVIPVMIVVYGMMAVLVGGPIYIVLDGVLGIELPKWVIWASPIFLYGLMFLFIRNKE